MSTVTERGSEPAVGRRESLLAYLLVGTFLGVVFVKSEVASWFRIQEMFRFQAFHMYGVIGSAVLIGAISIAFMKARRVSTRAGDQIVFPSHEDTGPRPHNVYGGICFGLGWGLLGACPGPIFALIGSGLTVFVVALAGATAGAWVYGLSKPRLPH